MPEDGITILVLGCGLEPDNDPHVGVRRDESGYDGLARIVDDFCITGNRRSGGWTDGDDASLADDNRGVVDGSAPRSIDYAGAAQRGRLGLRSGGCTDNARHGKSAQQIKYPSTKHAKSSH